MEIFKINDKRRWYREEYLKSDHWKKLRAKKLRRNPTCELCPSLAPAEPHHRCYREIFNVRLSDLISVCRACHDKLHVGIDAKKSDKKQAAESKDTQRERHHRLSEQLGRPPRMPVMRDKSGLPVVTVSIFAKKNTALLGDLQRILGVSPESIVGAAVPLSVADSLGLRVG